MKLRIFDENDHNGEGWKEIDITKEFLNNLVDYFRLKDGFATLEKTDSDDVSFIEAYAKVKEPAAIEMLRIVKDFGILHFGLPEESTEGASDGN